MGGNLDTVPSKTALNDKKNKEEMDRRNKLTKTPDDPQSVVAKTRARKKAAMSAQIRKGRTSTILSDTVG